MSDVEILKQLRAELQTALLNFDGIKVSALIEQGLDVSKTYVDKRKYRNALHELVLNYIQYPIQERPPKLHIHFIDIFKVLTENGLDVNEKDIKLYTALHHVATSPGHPEIIKELLSSGIRVNEPDAGKQTALHKAVLTGSKEDVAVLLEVGKADPNIMDNMGQSPIHVAVRRRNNADIIKLLAGCGGNVNINHPEWSKSAQGFTPLHFAARLGRVENAELLLELEADPNKVDSIGQTPLHVAAAHEITGVLCRRLLNDGAILHAVDNLYKETPLHKAVRANIEENVKVLLERGANVAAVDAAGNSVLHTAATWCRDPAIWHHLVNERVTKATATVPQSPVLHIPLAASHNHEGRTALDKAKKANNKIAEGFLKLLE